jgi:hypothetical protein
MYVMTLNGTSNTGKHPTYSSPFVDYVDDVLWVGDGNGRLHKFTGVFKGTPAEVVANGFPSTVAAGMKLSSPVYDSGNVYIGSQSGAGALGGKLHRIDAANGANRFDSAKLAMADTTGLRESPIVTGFPAGTGSVYGFLFNDGTAGDATNCAPQGSNRDSCRTVTRFPLGFAANATPASRAFVGRGNNINSTLYAGAFTDAYYTNGTGSMYIVGGEAVDTFIPRLWRVDLTNGNLTSSTIGPVLASKTCATFAGCGALDANGNPPNPNTAFWNWSPVTMARRGVDEYVYFSMQSHGGQSGCAGACVYQFHLNNLRNGTSEAWELNIASNSGDGIATNENNGTITVNGVTLAANVDFSTSGDRKADQIALMTAINSQSTSGSGGTGGIITVDNTRWHSDNNTTGASQIYFSSCRTPAAMPSRPASPACSKLFAQPSHRAFQDTHRMKQDHALPATSATDRAQALPEAGIPPRIRVRDHGAGLRQGEHHPGRMPQPQERLLTDACERPDDPCARISLAQDTLQQVGPAAIPRTWAAACCPRSPPGDILTFRTATPGDLVPGRIVLVQTDDGRLVAHRLLSHAQGHLHHHGGFPARPGRATRHHPGCWACWMPTNDGNRILPLDDDHRRCCRAPAAGCCATVPLDPPHRPPLAPPHDPDRMNALADPTTSTSASAASTSACAPIPPISSR